MTPTIGTLMELARDAHKAVDGVEATEWTDFVDALKPYSEYPLQSLTAKLRQVVLKLPTVAALKKPRAPARKKSTATPTVRVTKPKLTDAERAAAIEEHVRQLKDAFDDDAAFEVAFDRAKGDATFDAKSALKLFEGVIGPANFPIDPLRKPTIFKQLREQRNTTAYRRGRTGQTSASS